MELSETDILDLYVRLKDIEPRRRATEALKKLSGEHADDPLGCSLGQANRTFWNVRRASLDRKAEGRLRCNACDEWMELPLDDTFAFPSLVEPEPRVAYGGSDYAVRYPVLRDLLSGGSRFPVETLSPNAPWDDADFRASAEKALDEGDPGLDVVFDITCHACGDSTQARLEPFAFFWSSLQVRARELLADIVRLASAFGWTERECLRIGPTRRRLYLERLA